MMQHKENMFRGTNSNTLINSLIIWKTIANGNPSKEERAELHINLIKLIKRTIGTKRNGKLLEVENMLNKVKSHIVDEGSYKSVTRSLANKLFLEDMIKVLLLEDNDYKYSKVDFTKYQFIGTVGRVIPDNEWKFTYPDSTAMHNGLTSELQRLFKRLGLEQVALMFVLFNIVRARYENSYYFNLSLDDLNSLLIENND